MVEYLFGLAATIPPNGQSSSTGFYDVIDDLSLVYDQIRLEQDEVVAEADSDEERRQAHVQRSQIERELTTGRFAHGTQRREFTRRVFSCVNEELLSLLGFKASEAVSIADGIQRYHQEMFNQSHLLSICLHVFDAGEGPFQTRSSDVLMKALDDPETGFPSVWVNVAKFDNHRLNPLNSDYDIGEYSQYEDTFGSIRDVAPDTGFTRSDIHETSKEEFPNLDPFLENMSIRFGEFDSDLSNTSGSSGKFDYPFDHNPIHEYPLLVDQDGRYYLGPQNSLWFSLSTRFRYNILGSEYEGTGMDKIGDGVEAWTEECLENVDDEMVTILSGVDYDYENGESDVVLLYDDTIAVIEIKTRGLRIDSRLGPYGSFEQVQEDAKEVVGKPYEEQAMKLINGIKNGDVTELETEETTVQVDSECFSNYLPVIVVAQPLDFIGTILYADLLDFQDEYPFITDVYSLQTICRHLSTSHDLLEYIKKRVQIGITGKALSLDELDYLGAYLDHDLEYPDIPDDGVVNIIHNGSHLEREYSTDIASNMEHL